MYFSVNLYILPLNAEFKLALHLQPVFSIGAEGRMCFPELPLQIHLIPLLACDHVHIRSTVDLHPRRLLVPLNRDEPVRVACSFMYFFLYMVFAPILVNVRFSYIINISLILVFVNLRLSSDELRSI